MSEFNRSEVYVSEADGLRAYITGVFTKMGIALTITALVAYLGYATNLVIGLLTSGLGTVLYFVLIAAQFGVCIALSAKLTSMKTSTATTLLYAYAALTGLTFSVLLYAYSAGTVFASFGFCAVLFFSCAVIGHTTNTDLSKFSGLLMGGLITLVITSVVSIFIPALRSSLLFSYIGIILFLGITAWDMQRIKQYYYGTSGGYGQIGQNLAVYGAFQLYLDFINIFLYVLRILGRNSRRD